MDDFQFYLFGMNNRFTCFGQIQTSQTEGQAYINTSPHEINNYYLQLEYMWAFIGNVVQKCA